MLILPAIDLCDGKCIRLYQGDYEQVTEYAIEPQQQIQHYIDAGAEMIHLVDLSGAKNVDNRQIALIKKLAAMSIVPLQIGGGVRTQDDVQQLLDAGVSRVIVGSCAVQQPQQVQAWLKTFGADRIVLAFDCRRHDDGDYMIATQGWQTTSQQTLWAMVEFYRQHHAKHILCTDIGRDGTLAGPNVSLYQEFKQQYPELILQASGGMANIQNIKQLKAVGVDAVIIGKALYENRFTLDEVLAC